MSKQKNSIFITYIELLIIGFVILLQFLLPVLFTRIDGQISWLHVVKIWEDQFLLIPVFIINHWLFGPKLLLKKRYVAYAICIVGLISVFSFSYYFRDEVINKKPVGELAAGKKRPSPVPPYANLIMTCLLIVGVDTGLLFSKKWHENEENRYILEKENTEIKLDILRNQVSPHFFMNTLNNIYALIDCDTPKAKSAVMQLSKLMRYMLYENEKGKVKLSKEFEFMRSYVSLMQLRFADEVNVRFSIPEDYADVIVPPMLFITYIENAFKYGTSYQHESFVEIAFVIADDKLCFTCSNSRHADINKDKVGGLGMKNNEHRLNLIYADAFKLAVIPTEKTFNVSLTIPLI